MIDIKQLALKHGARELKIHFDTGVRIDLLLTEAQLESLLAEYLVLSSGDPVACAYWNCDADEEYGNA